MPKRSNPFGDSSPLQLKSHIRQKEVDMGIMREENMKAVYEKTKQLLFTGARKLKQPGQAMALSDTSHMMVEEASVKGIYHAPGQLCLNSDGQLAPPATLGFVNGFCNNNTMANPQMPILPPAKAAEFVCKTCSRGFGVIRPCHFCDRATCQDCLRQCSGCSGAFCPLCSTLNYEESMERAFCLNCAS